MGNPEVDGESGFEQAPIHTETALTSHEQPREEQGVDAWLGGDTEDKHTDAVEDKSEARTIYFNRPLPEQAKDERGHPRVRFVRNKIRTARYTPISFVPKNLYFQFHNVANIYFLFIIILSVGQPAHVQFLQQLMIQDILHLRRFQPRTQRCAFDRHSVHHCS